MFGKVLNTSMVFFLTEAAQMCIYEQVFWIPKVAAYFQNTFL